MAAAAAEGTEAMTASDAAFAGSIPGLYDRHLVPMLFEPYASDLAERAARLTPRRILETAAGTGVVTEALLSALPEAAIVATDLNEAMLAVAGERVRSERVSFSQADAQSLPFEDESFDLVACQFGVMFFPNRIGGYSEARRVLRPGGTFLFNVWDSLDANPGSRAVAEAVGSVFPDDPPSFLQRVPFGYHDPARIAADLREAGFADIQGETVQRSGRLGSPDAVAKGLCLGSPLRSEIEARDPARLDDAVAAATTAVERLSAGASALPMSALVFSARR